MSYAIKKTEQGLETYELTECKLCGTKLARLIEIHPTRKEGMDKLFHEAINLGAEQITDVPPSLTWHIHTDTNCPGHEDP